MEFIKSLLNKNIQVITNEGRIFIGILISSDNSCNLILSNCKEKEISIEEINFLPMGVYFIRGDNVCLVGIYENKQGNIIEKFQPIITK